MQLIKHYSVIMIFLVLSSNFFAECSVNHSSFSEVHFIAETCGSHDCPRNPKTHASDSKQCAHTICTDKTIIDNSTTQRMVNIPIAATLNIFTDFFAHLIIPFEKSQQFTLPEPISIQRSSILRI
jgi:hypothetical protein